jgi:hypothetical protein
MAADEILPPEIAWAVPVEVWALIPSLPIEIGTL